MRVFIRCDGGIDLGTGHIVRELLIAKELKKNAYATIEFLMKNIQEGVKRVEKEGFAVKKLFKTLTLDEEAYFINNYIKNKQADLLILDILDTSQTYMRILKATGVKIVSFDDHSEGNYLADLRFNILEFEIERSAVNLYEGPRYVTLNPIYADYHEREKEIRKNANKILITFGGSDPGNLTNKTLKSLEKIGEKLEINIVIGFAFPYTRELQANIKNSRHKIRIYKNISAQKMAELMFENDIGIAAGGLTQYEFASIGLPGIIICEDVQHQYELANWFENKGVLKNLGMGKGISEEMIASNVLELLNDYSQRQKLSRSGKLICDGRGLKRTIKKILEVIR